MASPTNDDERSDAPPGDIMTRRFDGAITTPTEPGESTRLPEATRPPRPLSIEISSAILIIGGVMATVGTLGVVGAGANSDAVPPWAGVVVFALLTVLNVLTVVVGILVRRGTAWIVCLNVTAIFLFMELTAVPSGRATAIALTALDAFVFVTVLRNRAWFDWRPTAEDHAA